MVSALPEHQRILLEIQDLDNRLARSARALASLDHDDRAAELIARNAALSPSLIEVTGALEDVNAEILRIESDVALVDQRLAQDTARIENSSNPRDIMGLEHEVATLRARKSALEDAELEAMERRDELQTRQDTIAAERSSIAAELATVGSTIDAERVELNHTISDLRAARQAVVERVPPDLYELYETQRQRYGVGAAALHGGVSGGSGMALSAHDLEVIAKTSADTVVLCPDSNCILVRVSD